MKTAGVLAGLLAIILVAAGTLCPPGMDNCAGGFLLHALIVITGGIALSTPLVPTPYRQPGRLIAYQSFCPDPAAPPPRG